MSCQGARAGGEPHPEPPIGKTVFCGASSAPPGRREPAARWESGRAERRRWHHRWCHWTSWAFNALGQRTAEADRSVTGADTTTNYGYNGNGANQPTALTSTATSGPNGHLAVLVHLRPGRQRHRPNAAHRYPDPELDQHRPARHRHPWVRHQFPQLRRRRQHFDYQSGGDILDNRSARESRMGGFVAGYDCGGSRILQ